MKSFAVVVLALIFAPAALAQHQTFAVNPDASDVKMKLNTTHEVVNGTFHVQSGSINFDRTASHISGGWSSSQRAAARWETTAAIKR
jgi:hypothetical protein